MPLYRVTITIEEDDRPLPGFPYVRNISVAEGAFTTQNVDGSGDATYSTLVPGNLATAQVVFVNPDVAVNVRVNGMAAGTLPIAAGGLLLAANCNFSAAALASINNPAATGTCKTRVLLGGQ